jgi:hypothetical protein
VGERLGHRVTGHGGTYNGFRALIERYPDDEISIIILSNLESSDITVTTFPAETIFGEGQKPHNRGAGTRLALPEAARCFTMGYGQRGGLGWQRQAPDVNVVMHQLGSAKGLEQ